jgi:hypothetical protein
VGIVQIAAIAVAIKQTAEALHTVYNLADSDRGIAIGVLNHTDFELEFAWATFDHGGWADPPDQRIPPKMASAFSVRDKGFMTGTKGWLTYQINGSDPQCWAQIFWDNPFIGTNSAGCWDFMRIPATNDFLKRFYPQGVPVDSAAFRMTALAGTGNLSQNQYEVFPL